MGTFYGSEQTPAQKTIDAIDRTMAMAAEQLKSAFEQSMGYVWQNPYGLTPQQVFDALGTMGADLIQRGEVTKAYLNAQKPGAITTEAPADFQIDGQGNVTVVFPSPSEG